MIVKMNKYTLWVYHNEFDNFLMLLQNLGVLHICEKHTGYILKKEQIEEIAHVEKIIRFLLKRDVIKGRTNQNLEGAAIVQQITEMQDELIHLTQKLKELLKLEKEIKIWGNFSFDTINKLKEHGYNLKFCSISQKQYNPELLAEFDAKTISKSGGKIYFVAIQKDGEKNNIPAEEIAPPPFSLSEIKHNIKHINTKISKINSQLDVFAKAAVPVLERYKKQLSDDLNFQVANTNAEQAINEKVRIIEGWIPAHETKDFDKILENHNIVYLKNETAAQESPPILINNNRFGRLFEPIGKLFSLPDYNELDLTIFFAPFFMMFFGFCLGDAGYGLLFIVAATLYKLKAKEQIKPVLSLLQYLGMATVIFGALTGTFFGINLIESEFVFLSNFKQHFLEPETMFNLALILGGLQIIFAMFLKAANQIRQKGLIHSASTFGWLIAIVGTITYMILNQFKILNNKPEVLYLILISAATLILFFNNLNVNIFARIGQGIWDIYSTITGIFGDILSYIRLFALGLSSSILGFVINDIGIQILGSSKIIGPVFFVIFLLFGHTLNILIASLGAFVHPMRLTFVEFYKNAGFKGGGKEYKPFIKQLKK